MIQCDKFNYEAGMKAVYCEQEF